MEQNSRKTLQKQVKVEQTKIWGIWPHRKGALDPRENR